MNPLVSICIPAYNQVEFLSRTLESLLIQEFRDFEVVICDDSTTEAVRDLVNTYQGRLPIHYHRNPKPLGSPANWNRCMDLAKGTYIKFVHHDDWFSNAGSLQVFVKAAQGENADFVFCVSEIHDQAGGKVRFNRPSRAFLKRLAGDPACLFSDNQIGAPTATMFRSTDLRFDPSLKFVVDIDFYIRYLRLAKFFFIDKPLIINTSGHAGQVTAASQDRETQLGEYSYLYAKHFKRKIPGLRDSIFFLRLFRSYGVKSLEEVNTIRALDLQPAWFFRLLIAISTVRFWKRKL